MTAAPSNIVVYTPPALPQSYGPLLPNTIGEAVQVAELLSRSRVIGDHLRGSVADCFLIVNQARLWRMDPFALAQGTAFIHGKMMYEGKVIAAVVHSLGNLSGRLNYEYSGAGDNRTVTVAGTLRGEDGPRTVEVRLKDARTTNKMWSSQPDQQLAYYGVRVWARRHVPEVVLGVYAPEDFPEPPMRDVTPPKAVDADPPPKAEKPPLEISLPHGWEPVRFERTRKGLKKALEFLASAVRGRAPEVVALNVGLLDTIAEKLPELAGEVSELRAAAAEALAGDEPGALDPEELSDQAELGRLDEFGLPPLDRPDPEVLPTDPPD
jgi:hypothetical protein